MLHIFLTFNCETFLFFDLFQFNKCKMEGNGRSIDYHRINSIIASMQQRISIAEETVVTERANVGHLSVDYSVLMGKFQNLEAEIINLNVQLEARDNELNGLYQLVEKLQKQLIDINIPPST